MLHRGRWYQRSLCVSFNVSRCKRMALLSSSSSVSEHRECAVRSVVRWSADATSALLRFALRSASASLAALCVPSLDKSFGT
jgi:hypothetical protein